MNTTKTVPEIFNQVVAPAIKKHNQGAKDAGSNGISIQRIQRELDKQKIFSLDSLSALSVSNWQKMGLPKALATAVSEKLKTEISSEQSCDLSFKELLIAYDPTEISSDTTIKLKKRLELELSRNPRVFVYFKDGTLDIEVTLGLYKAAHRGDTDLNYVKSSSGSIVRVYLCGQDPKDFSKEHPLARNIYLRFDGSDQFGFMWGKLVLKVAQLLRLAVESGELDVCLNNRKQLASIFDLASGRNAFSTLSGLYPNAALRFCELDEVDNLPSLKSHRAIPRTGKGGNAQCDSRAVIC